MINYSIKENYNDMARNIINFGVEYFNNNKNLKSMILGVSGGIDSALTAVLARRICDSLGNVKLHGYYLPTSDNKEDEYSRAVEVGSAVCHSFHAVDYLDKAFMDLLSVVDTTLYNKCIVIPAEVTLNDKIRMGNVKARMRMIYLYNQAQAKNGLVLSTDNLTEYLLGFFTIHGDEGDLGLIQNMWKTEVYGMAEAIGGPLASCIEAKPTDGLGITNNDLDQLLPGWQGSYRDGYEKVDKTLIEYIENPTNHIDNHVIDRYNMTKYKRLRPINLDRNTLISVY